MLKELLLAATGVAIASNFVACGGSSENLSTSSPPPCEPMTPGSAWEVGPNESCVIDGVTWINNTSLGNLRTTWATATREGIVIVREEIREGNPVIDDALPDFSIGFHAISDTLLISKLEASTDSDAHASRSGQ